MQSMTGFGRGDHESSQYRARVEMSSVNRKQADIVFNLPRDLAELEAPLRKLVLASVSRGRVNVSINFEKTSDLDSGVKVNESQARSLEAAFVELSTLLGRKIELTAADFLKAPDVFDLNPAGLDLEEAAAAIIPATEAALTQLIEMRTAEGQDLKIDLLARLDTLEKNTQDIAKAVPLVVERQRDLLHGRLRDAGIDLDLTDERLLKEIAIFAERCDISEETTRLNSHFGRFREYLDQATAVGRSLDFLCQEINREFNTIGSKANDSGIAQLVVSSKTDLEKIREQVQNLE